MMRRMLVSIVLSAMMSVVSADPAEFDRAALEQALQAFLVNPEAGEYQHRMPEEAPVRFDDEEQDEDAQRPPAGVSDYGLFYEQYLSQYYPKVYVIRSLFEHMAPEAMAQGLTDVVAVFSDKTWFYFMDTNKSFNPANYWEYVIDQCALLSEFFKNARIDIETKEVLLHEGAQESTQRADGSKRKTKNLYLYLKEHHKQAVADFYALCFDYVLKLFNEGIMLKETKQAYKYQAELEYIIAKLRNTMYEPEYQESMKTCTELIEILKEKIGINEMEMIDDFFGDDEAAKRLAYESLNLK